MFWQLYHEFIFLKITVKMYRNVSISEKGEELSLSFISSFPLKAITVIIILQFILFYGHSTINDYSIILYAKMKLP